MPTNPAHTQAVFLAAAALPDPTARSAYLDEACGEDDALRARVEALLRSHEERPDQEVSTAGAETRSIAPAPIGNSGVTQAYGAAHADPDHDDVLTFLDPPHQPGSLGRIGHYEVLEVLGRGGFGIVFRAFDEVLQRVVAVKMLAPQMAASSLARKRFLREARSSAAVRHENVVQVYAVVEQPLPYLVMEFIPGETLQQKLDRTGPLDFPEVLRIGRQVAEGLAAAHATGVIHRDIKPANVLIEGGPQARAKLTDFGLARAADDASISQSGVIAGTPMYMAPEQAKGESLDRRADLFSLGSVLYVMCTGQPPFRAETTFAVLKRVAEDVPRPIREVIPEVPEWLCRIVAKLHAKDPDERSQTAREVADLLAKCLSDLQLHGAVGDLGYDFPPQSQPSAAATAASALRASWRRWLAAAAILVGASLTVWRFWLSTQPPADPTVPAVSLGPAKQRVLPSWGEIVDLEGDCRFTTDGAKLTIAVPGEHRDLNPRYNVKAPRVMKEIDGDFDVQVKVLPFPSPRPKTQAEGEISFTGAGLVVWQDSANYVRLMRCADGDNRQGRHYVGVSPVENNRILQNSISTIPDDAKPYYLRFKRRGTRLTMQSSSDGIDWREHQPLLELKWSSKLRVGIAVVNGTRRPVAAAFENYLIVPFDVGEKKGTP